MMEPLVKWLHKLGDHQHAPAFPQQIDPSMGDLICVGGELCPAVVIQAYSMGLFPWTGEAPIPWYCPHPRLILPPLLFHASRNLRRLARSKQYQVRFDCDFPTVMKHCAAISRRGNPGTWITPNMIETYTQLYGQGIGHCVTVHEQGEMVGGLYGLSLGRAFFGESMFTQRSNCSKLALYALCDQLARRDFAFIDCQQVTPHLVSMGAIPIGRRPYLNLLQQALTDAAPPRSWRSWIAFSEHTPDENG